DAARPPRESAPLRARDRTSARPDTGPGRPPAPPLACRQLLPNSFWISARSASLGCGEPPSPNPEPVGACATMPAFSAARLAGFPERDPPPFFCLLPRLLDAPGLPPIGPIPGMLGTPPRATV